MAYIWSFPWGWFFPHLRKMRKCYERIMTDNILDCLIKKYKMNTEVKQCKQSTPWSNSNELLVKIITSPRKCVEFKFSCCGPQLLIAILRFVMILHCLILYPSPHFQRGPLHACSNYWQTQDQALNNLRFPDEFLSNPSSKTPKIASLTSQLGAYQWSWQSCTTIHRVGTNLHTSMMILVFEFFFGSNQNFLVARKQPLNGTTKM